MKAKPPHKGMDLEIAQKQKGIAWPGTSGAPPLSSSPSGSSLGVLCTTSAFKAPLIFSFLLYTRAWGGFFFAPSFSWVITATCQTRYFLYTPTHQTAWAFAVPSFFFYLKNPGLADEHIMTFVGWSQAPFYWKPWSIGSGCSVLSRLPLCSEGFCSSVSLHCNQCLRTGLSPTLPPLWDYDCLRSKVIMS